MDYPDRMPIMHYNIMSCCTLGVGAISQRIDTVSWNCQWNEMLNDDTSWVLFLSTFRAR